MKFTKMHGSGNDFIVIDDRKNNFLGKESVISKELCHRHFGIGADGILFVRESNIAEIQMLIINADGSYASMCGNGIRCFAKYVWDERIVTGDCIKIETGDGVKEAFSTLENGKVKDVTIYMGTPSFDPEKVPAMCDDEIVNNKINIDDREYNITSMFMGVPHTVVFGKLKNYDIQEGRLIEKHQIFPQGTNVNFCEVVDKNKVKVKTWERGAGATLACGTGCCASVVASNKLGFTDNKVQVQVPGGELLIEIKKEGVFMTGPAVVSFRGELDI